MEALPHRPHPLRAYPMFKSIAPPLHQFHMPQKHSKAGDFPRGFEELPGRRGSRVPPPVRLPPPRSGGAGDSWSVIRHLVGIITDGRGSIRGHIVHRATSLSRCAFGDLTGPSTSHIQTILNLEKATELFSGIMSSSTALCTYS